MYMFVFIGSDHVCVCTGGVYSVTVLIVEGRQVQKDIFPHEFVCGQGDVLSRR